MFLRSGEHADLRDHATHLQCAEGAWERARSANIYDEVDTLPVGLIKDPVVPLGVCAVIEALVEAEIGGTVKLGRAA